MTLTWAAAGAAIAIFEFTVLVDGCMLAIDRADDMHPLTGRDRFLEITTNTLSACQIEHITTCDSVWAQGLKSAGVHAEDPFMLARFTLAEPMNVACALRSWKCQNVRPDPR